MLTACHLLPVLAMGWLVMLPKRSGPLLMRDCCLAPCSLCTIHCSCHALSPSRLMLQVTMGRVEDPQIAKVFKMADRSNDLYQAWVDGGSPGTWGNVQRRYKDHAKQAQLPATPAAAPQSAGGAKRSKPGAVPGGSVASSSKNVIGWGRSAESRMYRVALFGVVQLHASVRIVFTTPL